MDKKICIVAPAIKMGGVERASVNFANNFAKRGYQVTLIALFNQEKFFKLDESIKFIEPENFNIRKLSLLKTILWLRKTINNENTDTVLVLGKFYSAITLVSLLFLKIDIFISERSSPYYKWPFYITLFSNIVFKLFAPNGVICQTSTALNVQKKYHRKSTSFLLLPNPLREITSYDIEKENIILAVGRLNDPNKGFDRLISAFSLIKNHSNWKLVFAGGNDEGEHLKKQAKQLKVSSRIQFEGKVKDIDYFYSKAKIFVIPSRSEGFPNALCEAMSSGLACIAFDFHCGPRDLIQNGFNGLIVKDGDIIKMAETIHSLIENKNALIKLGENAKKIGKVLDENLLINRLEGFIFNNN